MNWLKQKEGFTFVEILVALLIIIPVLLGLIGVNIYTFRAAESSKMIITAIQDAHTVIERIRYVATNQGLAQVVLNYPSGQAVAGFTNLDNEQIVVTYPNALADPLAITVSVNWRDHSRSMTRSLLTQVTRR